MVAGSDFNSALLREAQTGSTLGASSASTDSAKKQGELSKNDFLNLLVTQLKNQDPLEPMKNEEFAVNLAQFSQLEQLVAINEKTGTATNDLSSMAAYLGHNVTLDTDVINVNSHDGGAISFDLAQSASNVKIELMNGDGTVAESIDLGPVAVGKHSVSLANLQTANGAYQVHLVANGTTGGQFEPLARASGIVSGFIPGPEPKLIINGQSVDPASVVEVNVAS